MDGQTEGWVKGDRWTMDRLVDECMDSWMDEWTYLLMFVL